MNKKEIHNKDKDTYFLYYIVGVTLLVVFFNISINIKSTEEYYEKYYVLEDYTDNYQDIYMEETDEQNKIDNSEYDEYEINKD